jgi:hypothetical protein
MAPKLAGGGNTLYYFLWFNYCSIGQPTQMDDTSKVTERKKPNFNVSKDSENILKVIF